MAIEQSDDGALRELALFAGAGGGILGGKLLGWRTVCAVEREAYPAQVLAQRQNDGILEPFPIWSDVCSFDGRPWRGIVDVISGGFPCQDISAAGKGAGITGSRSGLWGEFKRIIREVEPRYVFVENSPMLTSRGLDVVLADLAEMGFDAEWGCLSAGEVGAPHIRDRAWICAERRDFLSHSDDSRVRRWKQWTARATEAYRTLSHANAQPSGEKRKDAGSNCTGEISHDARPRIGHSGRRHWPPEPNIRRVDDGVADGMDRLAALGNGQVSIVAAATFILLHARLTYTKG